MWEGREECASEINRGDIKNVWKNAETRTLA